MFDIGFSEILLIGIVALVVFGPEELPRVARTAGHFMGRLRRYVSDVKADISREIEASEMKGLVAEVQDSARSLQQSINAQAASLQAEFQGVVRPLEEARDELDASIAATGSELRETLAQADPLTPAAAQPTLATATPDAVESAPEAPLPEGAAPLESPEAPVLPQPVEADFFAPPPAPEPVPPAAEPEPVVDEAQLDLFGMPTSQNNKKD